MRILKRYCGSNLCEAVIVGTSAFGAGVLLTLFMPAGVLCGVCGLLFLSAGVACIVLK